MPAHGLTWTIAELRAHMERSKAKRLRQERRRAAKWEAEKAAFAAKRARV